MPYPYAADSFGKLVAAIQARQARRQAQEYGRAFGAMGDMVSMTVRRQGLEADAIFDLIPSMSSLFVDATNTVNRGVIQTVSDLATVGVKMATNANDPVMRTVLLQGGTRALGTDIVSRPRVLRELERMRAAGVHPNDAAKELARIVPAGRFRDPRTRAKLISRTESLHANRQSQLSAFQNSGVVTRAKIFDGSLPTSDDECRQRNGTIVSLAEAERLLSEEHPNGTMSFAPVVDAPPRPPTSAEEGPAADRLRGQLTQRELVALTRVRRNTDKQ